VFGSLVPARAVAQGIGSDTENFRHSSLGKLVRLSRRAVREGRH
jgi:hypothetical protein